MADEKQEDLARLFEAVAHPARIQMLKILQEKPRKFSELKEMLDIKSSGNLTHHLNKLEGIVVNLADGTYQITTEGKRALFLVSMLSERKRKGVIASYLLLSASLFYAIWLTFAYYLGPFTAHVPLVGLGFSVLFYCLLRLIVKKETNREDWQFLWSPLHKL
ncbi:MAG: winged helix-turn-helix transcriptional regulator [Candidatus Lokiarchaeota archaeon]|nr:winged helix-turn-helix transcriptional regulator [Candidatus Lokiarchaeota archaeon]